MSPTSTPHDERSTPGRYVIIGHSQTASRVCATLLSHGFTVEHLGQPDDTELTRALAEGTLGAAVLLHDDVASLRYALACAHVNPAIALTVTIFDRTIAESLRDLLPSIKVTSPADLATPLLAGPCIDRDYLLIRRSAGSHLTVQHTSRGPQYVSVAVPRPRFTDRLRTAVGSPSNWRDPGSRILAAGAAGLFTVLAVDWAWIVLQTHRLSAGSFQEAVSVVATVGPAPAHGGPKYQIANAIGMLLAIVFTAMFTAGIIDRLLGPRLVGMVGKRSIPRRDHVIVVGMGQVGLRLCRELRLLGVPVVGVERNDDAPNLRLVRGLAIPTVIGHGSDRELLNSIGARSAAAIVAVGSHDLDNIAVAVAAHAVAPDVRMVLRAGEQEAIAETRSLLPLGTTRDVVAICAAFVSAHMEGLRPRGVVQTLGDMFVETSDGSMSAWNPGKSADCPHQPA